MQKALGLQKYCLATGTPTEDCLSSVKEGGQFKQIAIDKCEDRLSHPYDWRNKFGEDKNANGEQSNQTEGGAWHTDYQKGSDGRMHRHDSTPEMREKVRQDRELTLKKAYNDSRLEDLGRATSSTSTGAATKAGTDLSKIVGAALGKMGTFGQTVAG